MRTAPQTFTSFKSHASLTTYLDVILNPKSVETARTRTPSQQNLLLCEHDFSPKTGMFSGRDIETSPMHIGFKPL